MAAPRPYLVSSRKQLAAVILRLSEISLPFFITIVPAGKKRSLRQNSLMWKWNGEIKSHMEEHYGQIAESAEWHAAMVQRLCEEEVKILTLPDGTAFDVTAARQLTRKFSVSEMRDYLNKLEMYCAECLNLQLSRPDDLYWKSVMEEGK